MFDLILHLHKIQFVYFLSLGIMNMAGAVPGMLKYFIFFV